MVDPNPSTNNGFRSNHNAFYMNRINIVL